MAASTAAAYYRNFNAVTSEGDQRGAGHYLDVHKFHKRKTKASHRNFVFDKYDPLHTLSTFLSNS